MVQRVVTVDDAAVETPTEPLPQKSKFAGYKIVGHRRELFFRDIASGMKYANVAMSHGCSVAYVKEVARDHKEYIAKLREELGNELNTVWLADKMEILKERAKSYSMICAHQRVLEEEAAKATQTMREIDPDAAPVPVPEMWHKYEQSKGQILRNIDEALGFLMGRKPSEDERARLLYSIKGVDMAQVFNEE